MHRHESGPVITYRVLYVCITSIRQSLFSSKTSSSFYSVLRDIFPASSNPLLIETKSGSSGYVPLNADQNLDDQGQTPAQEAPLGSRMQYMKALLCKCSAYLLGAVLVVGASIASQYHPPDSIFNGNYTDCFINATTTNTTNR